MNSEEVKAAQRYISDANEEINKLRDAVQSVLCDPGNPELSDATIAKLQAMRGPAISPSNYVVVSRADWRSTCDRLAAADSSPQWRDKPTCAGLWAFPATATSISWCVRLREEDVADHRLWHRPCFGPIPERPAT
jgi:hypothetical protein